MAQVYITSNKPSEKKNVKRNMLIVTNTVAHYSHLKNTMYYVSISKEKKKKKNTMYHHYRRYIAFCNRNSIYVFAMGFFPILIILYDK